MLSDPAANCVAPDGDFVLVSDGSVGASVDRVDPRTEAGVYMDL